MNSYGGVCGRKVSLIGMLRLHNIHNGCETLVSVAYPELVLRGVSTSHTFEWVVKVGASKGVIRVDFKKKWPRGFRATQKTWIRH